MAWPNPFRRHDENTRTCWGYTFQLTKDHWTLEQTYDMKYSYDKLGEEALKRLDAISPPPRSALPRNSGKYSTKDSTMDLTEDPTKDLTGDPTEDLAGVSTKDLTQDSKDSSSEKTPDVEAPPKRDLYVLLMQHAADDDVLRRLWEEVNTIPDWVDWEQIVRGQDVFYRYAGAALTGLAFQSLLGGMGASRVVETLARTGGFSTKVARYRLFESAQFILQCTRSLESIQPGGDGFASAIRVRMLHAAVRQRIMKLAEQRPAYFDVAQLGIPINDLDCIATIGSFSATLIWLAFPRQGIFLRQQEITDYLAVFRYLGYLLGTPTDVFATPEKTRAVMESLLLNEVAPTPTSRILAGNVIRALENQAPNYASRDFLEANSRWLNGNELCDGLGLGRPSAWYWALTAAQCGLFMFMAYSTRCIAAVDRRKIAASKRVLWAVIVEGQHGLGAASMFDFKYLPDLHKTTHAEPSQRSGILQPGIERRSLMVLLIGSASAVAIVYLSTRLVAGIARQISALI